MKLHIFCFVYMIFTACTLECTEAQQLDFLVYKPCPDLGKSFYDRDPYFIVSCTSQMFCTYSDDSFCNSLQTTDLQVYHSNGNTNIHVVNRTKCFLTVEMRNVTESDGGALICNDTINGHFRQRIVEVGYAPVEPRNLTMVFEPKKFVTLLIDRVKTGKDLNDDATKWLVSYTWGESGSCPEDGGEVDKEDGRYIACKLDLHSKYNKDGQYEYGSVHLPIDFTVTVKNKFGTTAPVFQTFHLQNHIKPNKLRDVQVNETGSTWITVGVKFPAGIEKALCQNMSENETSELVVQYKVTSMPEEEQHNYQYQNKTFHDLYGFYRNLDADNAALSGASVYPITREVKWSDCRENITALNITGLPLAFTFYNISVRAQGQYWGPWVNVPVKYAKTDEAVPEEGPKFDNSSYICFQEDQCVTCVIYFREIPRPKRGGPVLAYHLDAAEATGSIKETLNCSSAVSQNVKGDNNTIVMTNLHPAAVYNLTFYARTRKGQSPTTSGFLQTGKGNTTLATAQHVVVEKHGQSQLARWSTYEVSWSIPQGTQPNQNKYYVHYCFAKELEGIRSQPRSILKCMTNLVTEQYLNSSTRIKSVSLPFYRGQSQTDLSPAFFVSVETPDGVHSSLVKPECLYAIDRAPATVTLTVQMQRDNPQNLLVTFTHECRDDHRYRDGQPLEFHVHVAEMTSSTDCSPQFLKDGQGVFSLKLFEDVQPNEKTEKVIGNLKADTDYCVGVKAIKPNVDPVWTVTSGKTGVILPADPSFILLSVIFAIPAFIAIGVGCWLWCRHSRKFHDIKPTLPIPQPKSSGTCHARPVPPPLTSLPSTDSRADAARMNLRPDNSRLSVCDSGVITVTEKNIGTFVSALQIAVNDRYSAKGSSCQFANRQSLLTTGTSSDESAGQGNHGDQQANIPVFTRYPNMNINSAAQHFGPSQQNADNGDKEDGKEELMTYKPEEDEGAGNDSECKEQDGDEVPAMNAVVGRTDCIEKETRREEYTANQTSFDLESFDLTDEIGIDSILQAVGGCPLPALSLTPAEPAEENHCHGGTKPVGQSTMEAVDKAATKERSRVDDILLAASGCKLESLTPVQNVGNHISNVKSKGVTLDCPKQFAGISSQPLRGSKCVLGLSAAKNDSDNVGYRQKAGVEQFDSSTVDSSIDSILEAAIGCKLSALTPSPVPQGTQHIAGQPDKVKTLALDSSSQPSVHELPQQASGNRQALVSSDCVHGPVSGENLCLKSESDRQGIEDFSSCSPDNSSIPGM